MASVLDPIALLYERMEAEAYDAVRGHKPPPLRLRASEADDCPRKIFHRWSGHRPAPDSAEGKMYGACGDMDHDLTRQLFDHFGIEIQGIVLNADGTVEEVESLQKVYDVHVPHPDGSVDTVVVEVSARLDGLIETAHGLCVLEIKGTGFNSYKWLNDAWAKGGEEAALARIMDKHRYWYKQCQVTMALKDLDYAYLVVKDRSSGTLGFKRTTKEGLVERAGIHIPRSHEAFNDIMMRAARVKLSVERGVPPMNRRTHGSLDCTWCPFNYLCHGAEDRERRGLEPAILYPGPQIDSR